MEKWDLYTLDRVKTNRVITRGDDIPKNLYHLVVHVCIFNAKNQMLIQQRQTFKKGWPNMWDITVGGSAMIGENSRQAAMREVAEELGLKIDLKNTPPVITKYFSEGFDDIYILEKEIDISKLTLQYEEVQAVKWAGIEEILDMIGLKKFIPYDESVIQFLFHLHQVNSLYQK